MNKIYKVIWSRAKHCCLVVWELAKNHRGGKRAELVWLLEFWVLLYWCRWVQTGLHRLSIQREKVPA